MNHFLGGCIHWTISQAQLSLVSLGGFLSWGHFHKLSSKITGHLQIMSFCLFLFYTWSQPLKQNELEYPQVNVLFIWWRITWNISTFLQFHQWCNFKSCPDLKVPAGTEVFLSETHLSISLLDTHFFQIPVAHSLFVSSTTLNYLTPITWGVQFIFTHWLEHLMRFKLNIFREKQDGLKFIWWCMKRCTRQLSFEIW